MNNTFFIWSSCYKVPTLFLQYFLIHVAARALVFGTIILFKFSPSKVRDNVALIAMTIIMA